MAKVQVEQKYVVRKFLADGEVRYAGLNDEREFGWYVRDATDAQIRLYDSKASAKHALQNSYNICRRWSSDERVELVEVDVVEISCEELDRASFR